MSAGARRVRMLHQIDMAMLGIEVKAGFNPNQLRDPHTGEWIDMPHLDLPTETWGTSKPSGSGLTGHLYVRAPGGAVVEIAKMRRSPNYLPVYHYRLVPHSGNAGAWVSLSADTQAQAIAELRKKPAHTWEPTGVPQ